MRSGMSQTVLPLLSFTLFIGSAIYASLEDLVFALKLILELVLELLLVAVCCACGTLTGLEGANLFVRVVVCRSFAHYVS